VLTYRAGDAVSFNAWYTAYIASDKNGMPRVARKYFRCHRG
jgi:hypothetical protein